MLLIHKTTLKLMALAKQETELSRIVSPLSSGSYDIYLQGAIVSYTSNFIFCRPPFVLDIVLIRTLDLLQEFLACLFIASKEMISH